MSSQTNKYYRKILKFAKSNEMLQQVSLEDQLRWRCLSGGSYRLVTLIAHVHVPDEGGDVNGQHLQHRGYAVKSNLNQGCLDGCCALA